MTQKTRKRPGHLHAFPSQQNERRLRRRIRFKNAIAFEIYLQLLTSKKYDFAAQMLSGSESSRLSGFCSKPGSAERPPLNEPGMACNLTCH